MEKEILDMLLQLMPLWIIVVFAVMFFAMRFYYTRFKKIEDKINKSPCDQHSDAQVNSEKELIAVKLECINNIKQINANAKDIFDVKNNINDIKNNLIELKEDIVCIKSVLVQKYPNSANVFSMKKSPRKLNQSGDTLFKNINGEKFLNDNKEFFFAKIEEQKHKTALDVEIASNIACTSYTDNDMFNDIKNYVYNAPSIIIQNEDGIERKYDVSLGDVCFVLSIPLRDMYLTEHPDIIQ